MNRKLIQESEAGESEESEGGDLVAISNSPVPEGAGMIQIGILLRGWNLQKLNYTPPPLAFSTRLENACGRYRYFTLNHSYAPHPPHTTYTPPTGRTLQMLSLGMFPKSASIIPFVVAAWDVISQSATGCRNIGAEWMFP